MISSLATQQKTKMKLVSVSIGKKTAVFGWLKRPISPQLLGHFKSVLVGLEQSKTFKLEKVKNNK